MALTQTDTDTEAALARLRIAGLLQGSKYGVDDWLEIKYVCLGGIDP